MCSENSPDSVMTEATIDPLLGRTLADRLELIELLGSGAMGKVYRAHHHGLDKPVAIKILAPSDGPGAPSAARFKAEARAACRLDHPNSVRVFDFGQADGLLYLAMEYLPGRDLQEILRNDGILGTYRTAWIMAQVTSALGAAHDAGVVHRDLKPGNIMLIDRPAESEVVLDFVKVCDFGLAKILDPGAEPSTGPLTAQGTIFGTPAYMSPEQAQGLAVDGRSDIYSCGVVLYKMMTGRTPFRGGSATDILMRHILEPVVPPSALHGAVDPAMERIILRCMAKDRSDRFESARQLRDALRDILNAGGLDLPYAGATLKAPAIDARSLDQRAPTPHHRPLTQPVETRRPTTIDTDYRDTAMIDTLIEEPDSARLMTTLAPTDALDDTRDRLPPVRHVPWWTWIPGALALMLTGVLAAYLLLGPH